MGRILLEEIRSIGAGDIPALRAEAVTKQAVPGAGKSALYR